jgi:ABC-type multidrug transport system fused ATPase/permease subunit
LNFNGGFVIRIDLSLGALSWLYLAESANSFLAGGELASSIESRALAKLRQNYGQEIERQVRAKSSEAVLNFKFAEFARRPFNDLMRRFDQEVKVLLDDSVAALASLRAAAVPGGDAGHDWEAVHRRIESVAEECERIVFTDRPETLQAAS